MTLRPVDSATGTPAPTHFMPAQACAGSGPRAWHTEQTWAEGRLTVMADGAPAGG
jgi:hypothetical protein